MANSIGLIETKFNVLPLLEAGLQKRVQLVLAQAAVTLAADMQSTLIEPYPPASLPGQPPHMRSGDLYNSVQPVPNSAPLEALVLVHADYATTLEYGGARVAARPFAAPAAARAATSVQEQLDALAADLVGSLAAGG